jgi:hypothetical protein
LSLLSMQLDYYNTSIQRVFDQIKDRNSHSLYAHKLYFKPANCILSGKSCKMYDIFTMLSSFVVSFQHFQIK